MRNIATLHKPSTPFVAINRTSFAAALEVANKVIVKKNTIPILSAIRMTVHGEALRVTVTNLDIEVKLDLEAAPDSTDMDVVLLVEPLRDFLKMSDGELIRITSSEDGERATVSCNESSIEMTTFDVADFPDMGKLERKGSTVNKVSPSAFWRALDCCKLAMSTEETRYYLHGIFMHPTPDGLKFVATDGHRLHSKQTKLAPKSKAPAVIIPAITAKLLLGVIRPTSYADDLAITTTADGTRARFALDNFVLTSKMVDGTFPDYSRVLPAADQRTVTIDGAALDRVLKNGPKDAKAGALAFFPDSVQIKMIDIHSGTSSITKLPATLDGEPLTIGFNRKYLRDMIGDASPGGEAITIKMSGDGDPALVEGSERGFVGVLMPMRV